MMNNGEVEFSNFEEEILLNTVPSKVGQKESELEKLLFFYDKFIKFDFIVSKSEDLEKHLNYLKKEFIDYFDTSIFVENDLETAYDFRDKLKNEIVSMTENIVKNPTLVENRNSDLYFRYSEIQNKDEFKFALNLFNCSFSKDSLVFLYGSSIKQEKVAEDFDFKIIVPNLSKSDYVRYMKIAYHLKNFEIPITYSLSDEKMFKTLQLLDSRNIFSSNNSILVKGSSDIYNSNIKDKINVLNIGKVLSKVRTSMIKEYYYENPGLIRSISNEPYHMNNLFVKMFGDKKLKFCQYDEIKMSRWDCEKRLVDVNNDFSNLLEEYKLEIKSKLL